MHFMGDHRMCSESRPLADTAYFPDAVSAAPV